MRINKQTRQDRRRAGPQSRPAWAGWEFVMGVPADRYRVADHLELLIASIRRHSRWAHVLLGIVFLAGAIWAFVHTFGGFWASQQMVSARAALLISWVGLLVPFRGITEIVAQAPHHQRGVNGEDGEDTGHG